MASCITCWQNSNVEAPVTMRLCLDFLRALVQVDRRIWAIWIVLMFRRIMAGKLFDYRNDYGICDCCCQAQAFVKFAEHRVRKKCSIWARRQLDKLWMPRVDGCEQWTDCVGAFVFLDWFVGKSVRVDHCRREMHKLECNKAGGRCKSIVAHPSTVSQIMKMSRMCMLAFQASGYRAISIFKAHTKRQNKKTEIQNCREKKRWDSWKFT